MHLACEIIQLLSQLLSDVSKLLRNMTTALHIHINLRIEDARRGGDCGGSGISFASIEGRVEGFRYKLLNLGESR